MTRSGAVSCSGWRRRRPPRPGPDPGRADSSITCARRFSFSSGPGLRASSRWRRCARPPPGSEPRDEPIVRPSPATSCLLTTPPSPAPGTVGEFHLPWRVLCKVVEPEAKDNESFGCGSRRLRVHGGFHRGLWRAAGSPRQASLTFDERIAPPSNSFAQRSVAPRSAH